MVELLEHFSLSQIFIFVALFVLVLKGGISLFDWFTERGNKFFNENYQEPKELEETVEKLVQSTDKLAQKVDMLVQSDKDDIKAFITKQHHYFCYKVGSIDDQSLDCIEKRYTHYKKQGGNSYIHHLMEQLRELPRDVNLLSNNTPQK